MNAGIERINTVFEDMKAVAINIKAIYYLLLMSQNQKLSYR